KSRRKRRVSCIRARVRSGRVRPVRKRPPGRARPDEPGSMCDDPPPMKSTHNALALAAGIPFLALSATAAAQANTESDGIDTVITTGTRLPDDRALLPGRVTVIDRAAIEAANAASVLDLLRDAPGPESTPPGGRGGAAPGRTLAWPATIHVCT